MPYSDLAVIAVVIVAVFAVFYRHGQHSDIAERRKAEARGAA